jgi:YHS domain-containing protein
MAINKPQWFLALAGWVLALGLLFMAWRALDRLGLNPLSSGAPGVSGSLAPDSPYAIDPVSMEKLLKGEPNCRVLYQRREYWFTSKVDKMAFLTDPERYLGGKSLAWGLSPTASALTSTAALPLSGSASSRDMREAMIDKLRQTPAPLKPIITEAPKVSGAAKAGPAPAEKAK